jgi:hypothetical protein
MTSLTLRSALALPRNGKRELPKWQPQWQPGLNLLLPRVLSPHILYLSTQAEEQLRRAAQLRGLSDSSHRFTYTQHHLATRSNRS